MPQTSISINKRPNVQTEKVGGWNILNIFKACALYFSGTYIFIPSGKRIIEAFINAGSNMKGKNLIYPRSLENFNSFRFKANGTVLCDGSYFDLWFTLRDINYDEIANVQNDYGNGHKTNPINVTVDWYLDLEITYFLNDDQKHVFLVNGKYIHNSEGPLSQMAVSCVPISGEIETDQNRIFLDVTSFNDSNSVYIKDINIDFIE